MSSSLLPATVALLSAVKPRAPLFSNQILAELFDARHTLGAFKILPSSEGGYVVFDTRAALGAGVVSWHVTVDGAQSALERAAR